ncbi:EAL domain-containing protein [Pseudobutyrivibrio xylanivorans]|uniref:EAL domain-containing protein n=1 Tax=Pseudobutyrivibrio xylanivorans TaxID=185007 RepID=A0A5P6VQR1_PSEXY|nr:EAL domain-containing protein [Pseudobutyrivibrio xylanivorans]QFJ54029.1 EAL domain-containing protein [Pseudobutyrivibrio xylanivorans]
MTAKGDYREIRMSIDELTGLLDKQTFYECAQELLDSAVDEQEYAFVFFDLENFKIFNVNYGYEIGDELLISIGYIIKDVFSGQLISHFSGDHFVVCANSVQIVPSIKTIRDRIKLVQKSVNIELKAGIYIFNGEEKDVIRCCDRARMACISIKKKYDVEYRFYDEELGGSLKRKQDILDSLDEALAKKYIKVYYQPIVRTMTGKVCSWEALVRWIDPNKGMFYPNEFIPILEEYRLIAKLDAFVMEEIFSRYRADVEGKTEAVPVSINLSRVDFEVMDVVALIEEKLRKYGCQKNMFHFEITESALNDNSQFIMEQVNRMREKGYVVWMDDFGSGYSSLNVLKNYNFDLVKIDMAFLSDFEVNDNGKIILRHIVSMIKNLNIHTLIEGVETQEQYDFIKSIGCELIQGYLIGRPMPYIQGLEHIQKSERDLETAEERFFYEDLGKIDILRQNPLQNIENTNIENALPLAIAIIQNKHWHFVYTNSAYRDLIALFGHDDVSSVEDELNDAERETSSRMQRFLEICDYSRESRNPEAMDFISKGRIVNMMVRYICSDETTGRNAYLISIRLLSRLLNAGYDERVNAISRSMFARYECVDVFGIDNDYYENIYLNDSRLHINGQEVTAREMIRRIGEELVHPDDKLYFDDFFDMETVEDRISEESAGYIVGFFRILNTRNTYVWKAIELSLMHFDKYDALLSCVCEASNEISRRMTDSSNKRVETSKNIVKEKKPIFEDILKLLPVGVFWKDKERRFLGANQMFLDYYGLQSVEGILGKTDEDMGWHINPERFKQDELSVINEGKIIEDVRGECIVKGEVRKIIACKRPYIVDRKIIGLVGYFKDVTDEQKEQARLEKLTVTDALTGLYNRRAFTDVIQKYVDQYNTDKSDFALIMLDIDRFKQINDTCGHDYGDEVLKKASKVLKRVALDNSVVFRFGGDEFIIIHQYTSDEDIESIIQEIRIGLTKLEKVSNTLISIKVSIGVSRYSETGSISECLDEADKRMYMDKESHKKDKF